MSNPSHPLVPRLDFRSLDLPVCSNQQVAATSSYQPPTFQKMTMDKPRLPRMIRLEDLVLFPSGHSDRLPIQHPSGPTASANRS